MCNHRLHVAGHAIYLAYDGCLFLRMPKDDGPGVDVDYFVRTTAASSRNLTRSLLTLALPKSDSRSRANRWSVRLVLQSSSSDVSDARGLPRLLRPRRERPRRRRAAEQRDELASS